MSTVRSTVGALFVGADGRVLLGLRSAGKTSWPNHWDTVGGGVEPGETLEQALIREAQEEVGVTPLEFTLVAELPEQLPHLHGDAMHHVFVVSRWTGGAPRLVCNEHSELRWFTADELKALPNVVEPAYARIATVALGRRHAMGPSFEVDAMWGAECSGYHLQFQPEPDVIGEIVGIQDRIASQIGHLRRVPPEALHMSVVTLLPATPDKAAAGGAWARSGAHCIASASRLCESSRPLPVEWTWVQAFDKAIVLAGSESERLKKFRADVADTVAEPGLRPQAPRIAHVSLFRYAAIDPRLQDFAMHCGTVATELREIRLVREDRYPSLELEVLRRWPLGPR